MLVRHVHARSVAVMAALFAVLGGLLALPAGAGHEDGEYFDLAALPAPEVTGKEIAANLERFEEEHPLRITGTPQDLLTALEIEAEMGELGYTAAIEDVAVNASAPAAPPLRAVTARKLGTTRPDEWILFVGHYDQVATTVTGTYDNGSGTTMLRALAKSLADVPTNRSIMFVWYNGEEQGLLASARHAAALKAAGTQVTAVLGFDMVGIAWPVASPDANSCLCFFHGVQDAFEFEPLLKHVHWDFLRFPSDQRSARYGGANTRNSDERSFANQGYPTMRWAGRHPASSYSQYHMLADNFETILASAGGREYYEQGAENTLKGAYYTALALDNHLPVPEITALTQGTTVTLSAASSHDADGPLADFAWQLGDGGTAQGDQVVHTYAGPGTYTVTLTVADNLWPEVTRTITRDVTIG